MPTDDRGDGALVRLGLRFTNWAERWFPDAYVFVALGVEPQDVIPGQAESADGCLTIDAGVWPMPVVAARTRGRGQSAIHHGAHHLLSTSRGQTGILVGVHSVPRESLRFGNISVPGSDRMDNVLKVHS
jgi:hypothetical protein